MPLRVMIAGGGTGGHVMPALAIGRELRDKYGAEVLFVGTARGLETKLVPEAGFRLELVRSGQLKNVSLMTRLKTLADLPLGVLHCMRLLGEFRPQVVVGVGGYASGPAMIAAVLKGIPTLAYEPNAVPGMTNRLLGKRVSEAAIQASWNLAAGASAAASFACVPTWHEDFRKDLARVDVPTLVIHGDADRIVPIGAAGLRTAKLIKGSRLVTVKDGPHCVTWTHAEEVNRELVNFLAS